MQFRWKTLFTDTFPWCTVPIMGAPMNSVSGGKLAAETCRAGALGFLAAGDLLDGGTALKKEIELFRQHQFAPEKAEGHASTAATTTTTRQPPPAPLCIGFLGFSAVKSMRFETVLAECQPDVVQFFGPAVVVKDANGKSNLQLAKEYGAKVIVQVGSVKEAREAMETGAVDAIIAQGSEAGGHGLRRELGNGTLSLASSIVRLVDEEYAANRIPVLAAGGIMDGKGLAAALALGCSGAVLGTRLWASREAMGNPKLKEYLVQAQSCDDVIRTPVFDQILNHVSATAWPYPFDSTGVIRNKTSDLWDGRLAELDTLLTTGQGQQLVDEFKKAQLEGDTDHAMILSGENVGEVKSIDPAFDIITRISEEAGEIMLAMPKFVEPLS